MFWIVEQSLYSEANFSNLVRALKRLECDYEIVRRLPISNTMDPDVTLRVGGRHVFVCGSTGMGALVKQKGWLPGYFDENLDYELIMRHFGRWCLNHRGVITTVRDADGAAIARTERFFARPVADSKTFNGTVFDAEQFAYWRANVIADSATESPGRRLKPDDRIVLAPLSRIYQEYRFFVIDEKVVTGTMYMLGQRVVASMDVPERVSAFAQRMASHWSPNRAYCLDIAVTDDDEEFGDLKVIEINAMNSSGFYACDMLKLVSTVNDMQFD